MSTQIMGIINITPDSFSGDGVMHMDAVLQQANDFITHGATILDVGGESTRPHAPALDMDTELSRVIPVITALVQSFPDVTISIDTYKSMVAERALSAGASMLNDVWGGLYDGGMLPLARDANVPICLMHNPRPWTFDHPPAVQNIYTDYHGDVVSDAGGDDGGYINHVKNELTALVDNALSQGVDLENIIADVGLGFGRDSHRSMALLTAIDDCRPYDCPMLIAPSRKSFVGDATGTDKTDTAGRDAGTTACVALGIASGADIVRVHNVKMMANVVKMTDALLDV